MFFRREGAFLFILIIFVAILCYAHVGAARVLLEDFAGENHLATYPSMYEKAKLSMECWLERLASGPSPKGPGH
ncbi:Autophagy-related protein like [Actinidia chinensis var. chinensis]|uniref:Autophagy-related protein like n=1 Tax=Actinidia chinensis var. chinensis TaxID=1590841 RepID=A0A2R6S0C9_ACTCC|nr:Autophagy-related protein like [Actinidia chinensis var. chinensis]